MDALGSAPWLALVLLTLAAALAVLEAAVPGLGLAGGAAAVLGAIAALVVWQADVTPLPLVAVVAATALWALAVGWPRPPWWAQAAAAALHAGGGVAYGLAADDRASLVVAALGSAGLAAAFPALHGWTRRLVEQQPRTGMEALVGRVAVVERVPGDRLVVRLDGSLWNLAAPGPLAPGSQVVVRGWEGMALRVEPVAGPPRVRSGPI